MAIGVFPGSTVSIVGFPHGLTGPALSAIWKTGAVASEPELLVNGHDFFWIDANTRSGMSGAPVIARRFGSYVSREGDTALATGIADRLLGVYAGRALDAIDMTLGRVWRWGGVEEILREADTRIATGSLQPVPTTLGHFPENSMPTIVNRQATIQNPPPAPPLPIAVADVLRQVAGADQRFGMSLERLKLAASVAAACNGVAVDATFEISQPAAPLLAECLKVPQGWNYPQNFYQIVALVEQALQELEAQ